MTKQGINFTPGPSQLYFTVEAHMKQAFREGIPSLSHRSKAFEAIYRGTTEGLRELLGLPPGFHILFTGSATEIWERVIQNLVEYRSMHLVNGSFSQRFYEVALQLNRSAEAIELTAGRGFPADMKVSEGFEVIAVTHNETSTGASLPVAILDNIRSSHSEALIVVDAVSSLPYPEFNYNALDSLFFSVQKGFGLPAGLGVWICNERCLQKAVRLQQKNFSIGSYHNLPSLVQYELKYQTPETPNVLAIYLLGKVVADMLRVGIHKIRKDTEYKAAILYQELERHRLIRPFVAEAAFRSQTVIVAESGSHTKALADRLAEKGLHAGDGYGKAKATQLRFANFPTHAKEHFELLCDTIRAYDA